MGTARRIPAADTPAIDRNKIAYFGISVFWRASIHTWELEGGKRVKIDLGPKYNEELRQYLMGLTAVPKNVSLQLVVCSDALNRGLFFAPAENQKIKDCTFIFFARGMQFYFRISNTLKDFERRLSIVNTAERWITGKGLREAFGLAQTVMTGSGVTLRASVRKSIRSS